MGMNESYTLYNQTVMDHFMNPRNMGDIKEANAIGEVGAAACFDGDTLIATADGNLHTPIKNLVNKITPVWSFNTKTNLFEIKNAIGVVSGVKKVYKLTLNDGGTITCTEDHKFLTRPKKQYVENKLLTSDDSIYPFKRKIIKNGYWEIRKTKHRKEHIEIYKFHNPDHNTIGYDIHHIDENKQNNCISNLQGLPKSDHTKLTNPNWDRPKTFDVCINKDILLENINKFDDKSELANHFSKLATEEQRKLISLRQKGNNNCYHKTSDEWKYKFASKPRNKNPKWLGYSDEDLFKIGNNLYKQHGKLTANLWRSYAKQNKIPQSLSTRFPSWTEFFDECKHYNHNIIKREYIGEIQTYTLQVEENNNYIVLSRITLNVEEGIVVKNCGDIMKISLRIDEQTNKVIDARFKTFGCLGGNSPIATPNGYTSIKNLKIGDQIWTWNGSSVVKNTVKNIVKKEVSSDDLCVLDFGLRKKIICTKDHVWWGADNRPLVTENFEIGMEVLEMTERELRSINNVRKQQWLKDINSKKISKRNNLGLMKQKELPQNQKKYKRKNLEISSFKTSISCKKMWKNPEYVKNWQEGIKKDQWKRPTLLEKKFINKFVNENLDLRYVGDYKFWINTPDGKRFNPDFKVNGQKKVIEVYTKNLPHFMQNRENQGWMIQKRKDYSSAGFDVMFVEKNELDTCINDIQRFIHNGIALKSKKEITHVNELRGLEKSNDNYIVYDLELNEGSNCFFVLRAMSHNCGSAIAASSVATELIKGRTIEDLEKNFSNDNIVEALGGLPPVKIHCSVLAQEALNAALDDYKKRKGIR
jgi:NifU-like protein involved in Fe-S cluster formation